MKAQWSKIYGMNFHMSHDITKNKLKKEKKKTQKTNQTNKTYGIQQKQF